MSAPIPIPQPYPAAAGVYKRFAVRSGEGAAAAAGAPQWFTDMTDKTWTTVANGTGQHIADVIPEGASGANGICTAYTGACVDQATNSYIFAAAGGHSDYAGNEVYSLDLSAATPAWARLNDPSSTASAVVSPNYAELRYADGSMPSTHHYHKSNVDTAGNIWWSMADGTYSDGNFSIQPWKFDISEKTWTRYTRLYTGTTGNANLQQSPSAYDPIDNRLWTVHYEGEAADGSCIWYVDCSNGAATAAEINDYVASSNGQKTWCGIAPDLRLLVYGSKNSSRLCVVDLDGALDSVTSVAFTGTLPTTAVGCVYHEASRAFLLWHSHGADVLKLAIPADPISGTWAVSTVTPAAGNSVTPTSGAASGTYTKFNIVEDMGNGQSALVVLNAYDGATYVYKLPAAGV